jgi:hypothetical protein
LSIATSRAINAVLIIGLALIPTILIIYKVGFCLISKLIKITVLVLSICFILILCFLIISLYILEAKHLSFITVIKGTAGLTLSLFISAAIIIMLCVCLIVII